GHEDLIASIQANVEAASSAAPATATEPVKLSALPPSAEEKRAPTAPPAPIPAAAAETAPSRNNSQTLAAVRNAVEENRLDIYLQPLVTLPQRKVRYYEAVTRLRDDKDQLIAAEDFIGVAEAAGMIGRIDHMVMLRCVQVLRRLMVRNKEVGVFCNVAHATLAN